MAKLRKCQHGRPVTSWGQVKMEAISAICHLLGLNPVMTHNNTTEWQINETTIDDLAPSLKERLTALGARFYNVDTSREPYYFVAVRWTGETCGHKPAGWDGLKHIPNPTSPAPSPAPGTIDTVRRPACCAHGKPVPCGDCILAAMC